MVIHYIFSLIFHHLHMVYLYLFFPYTFFIKIVHLHHMLLYNHSNLIIFLW